MLESEPYLNATEEGKTHTTVPFDLGKELSRPSDNCFGPAQQSTTL